MPTITIETSNPSPTTSSRSNSHSDTYTDEEGSSGTGIHVSSSGVESHTYSEDLDEWDPVYADEIEPSDSASRPPVPQRYQTERSRAPSAPRGPPSRRHSTAERPPRRPRVHRHPAPVPPSSVDPLEEPYPGYGRGYPTPQPGPYGGGAARPGYAQSSYSGGPGGYAPPYSGAPGALTHYGAPSAFQYSNPGMQQHNPFSPQPTPAAPGGASYFSAPHHMSGHSTPGAYSGHEMMPMAHHGYGGFPGYHQPGMPGMMPGMSGMPQHMQYYPPQWSPPGDISDPEAEKKMIALEEALKKQKLDHDAAQKELSEKMEKEHKQAAEKAEKAQKELEGKEAKALKELADRDAKEAKAKAELEAAKKAEIMAAEAAKKAAEERVAWEKKLEEETKEAMKKGMESARLAQEAEQKKAAEKAAEEKEKAEAAALLAKVRADAAAEAEKLKKEAAEEATKLKKEAAEALAKAVAPPPEEKKKPIKFKDAVGRKFSFPFELCATFAGMDELIQQAFMHVDVIGPHVRDGHYDLIGPNGEIILPQVWETMIEPDWAITMHMWPMPEPKGPPPGGMGGVPPGGGRPHSGRSGHGHRGPPVPPGPGHRGPPPQGRSGGPPPPPPAHWPPGAGGPHPRHAGGGGGSPPVVVMSADGRHDRSPPRNGKSKKAPSKGMLGWLSGGNAPKPSGKGPKKAEPYDPCRVM